jgi:hypothetical protein
MNIALWDCAQRVHYCLFEASNVNQSQKLLFICSQNRLRSLTAETMYQGFPGYDLRSAGTEPGARIR